MIDTSFFEKQLDGLLACRGVAGISVWLVRRE